MFKLIFRSIPMIALGALIAIGATAGSYFILKGMADKLLELHIGAVLAAIIVLPGLVTVVAYQMATAAQKLKVFTLMVGLILISAAVDNFLAPQMRLLADSVLLFNWIALVVNLVAGIAATVLLVTVVPDSVYADGGAVDEKEDPKEKKRREQEEKQTDKAMSQGSGALRSTGVRNPVTNAETASQKADDKVDSAAAKVSAEQRSIDEERQKGSTSATNLKGLLDTLAPDEEEAAKAKPSTAELDAIKPSTAELDAIKPSSAALDAIKTPGASGDASKPEAKSPLKSMLKKPDSPTSQLIRPKDKEAAASAQAPEAAPSQATPEAPAPVAEVKESPNTTMRLQAQKRKGTSTFTKLQALSASGGVGRTEKPQGAEGEGLKSILDRLDSGADAAEEAPMDSLFGGDRLVSTSRTDLPAVTEESGTTAAAPTNPAAPPSQLKRPGLGVTLGGTKPKTEAAPAAVPSTPIQETVATPAPEAPASGESMSDMLNSIQTPSSLAKEPGSSSGSGLGGSKLGSSALGKSGTSNKIGIGTSSSTSSTSLTPVPAPVSIPEPTPEPITEPVAEPVLEETIVETPPSQPAAATEEDDDDSQSIFGKGVDQEIDDIFSNLVSEEAQKEVKDADLKTVSGASAAEVESAAAEAVEVESEGGLLKAVDKEVDDIFDNLVSAEAQREVSDSVTNAPVVSAPATEKAAEEEDEEEQSSLFGKSLDSELDDIFSNLAPDEAQKKVTTETLAQVRAGSETSTADEALSFAPPESSESTPATTTESDKSKSGKFVDTLGNLPAVDAAKVPVQLSSKDATATPASSTATGEHPVAHTETADHPILEEPAAPPAPANTSPAEAPAASADESSAPAAPVKEIKEFGRLSARVSASAKPSETPGTMKTIGKLLIDVQAVENVIRNGETGQIGKNLGSARVLSAQRGEGIQMILNKIDAYPGIAGSLIVGHDGLVIASTLKGDLDRDTLGVLTVACLSTSNLGTRKLEIGKLKQMVMITNTSVNVFTDVDVGILAVFMTDVEINKIDGLLETIQTTIHG